MSVTMAPLPVAAARSSSSGWGSITRRLSAAIFPFLLPISRAAAAAADTGS